MTTERAQPIQGLPGNFTTCCFDCKFVRRTSIAYCRLQKKHAEMDWNVDPRNEVKQRELDAAIIAGQEQAVARTIIEPPSQAPASTWAGPSAAAMV